METLNKIVDWAKDKNLVDISRRDKQMLKMTEELGELAAGIARGDETKVKDSIGDCVVVLTILAAQSNMTIQECIEYAYNEIKGRTGKTVNGIFIKDEEKC